MSTATATSTMKLPARAGAADVRQPVPDTRYRLEAAVHPDHCVIDVRPPELTRRRSYQVRYYATAVRALCRTHRLAMPAGDRVYRTDVRVDATLQRRWLETFEVPPGSPTRLTYYSTSGTLLFMKMLADLGINFRHLLHLASDMCFLAPEEPHGGQPIHYRLSARIGEVSVVGDDRVCLVVHHVLTTPAGDVVQRTRETFAIGGVDRGTMASIQSVATPATVDVRKIMARRPQLGGSHGVHRTQIFVERDAGLRYGAVSGDLNVVHTTRVAARLFGFRGAFLQGLGTANHVLADIARQKQSGIERFAITFARPLYVGQTVEVARDQHTFEVIDERGRVVAYGTYASRH